MYIYICTYIHIYMYIYTHTHTYIHTYISGPKSLRIHNSMSERKGERERGERDRCTLYRAFAHLMGYDIDLFPQKSPLFDMNVYRVLNCSVLQCVAVCCSVLQCVAVCSSV